jgi:hypothetical protein
MYLLNSHECTNKKYLCIRGYCLLLLTSPLFQINNQFIVGRGQIGIQPH